MNDDIESIEVDLFLEAVYRKYGYDFRDYARASIKRRIRNLLSKTGRQSISEMIPDLLYDDNYIERWFSNFSITVTEMFRDPNFYVSLKKILIPYLKTYPFIKIWHAGCSTGEEVYSLAILLKEEGLYDRATIFGTDFNDRALKTAREGIYPIHYIQNYTKNYQQASGKCSFSEYYHANYDAVILNRNLKENITFANHNLVTDRVFGEMHLILCRNVLIYFNKKLQNHVLSLFKNSLIHHGFLAIGSKESLRFSEVEKDFDCLDDSWRIYRKNY